MVICFQHQANNVILFKQVKLLLAGERKICDQIFDGVNFNKGHCFAELTANSIITLFSFGDAVAKSKRSPEKLFVLLDMYEVMRELQPEVFWKYLIDATIQMLHTSRCWVLNYLILMKITKMSILALLEPLLLSDR